MKLYIASYATLLVISSLETAESKLTSRKENTKDKLIKQVQEEESKDEAPSALVDEDVGFWGRVLQDDMSMMGPPEDLCADVTCDNPIEGCDPFDGICKPKDAAVPCIAIIDESDNFSDANIAAKWANFRELYPDRPFCLLQPLNSASSRLYLPPSFLSDSRTTFAQVSRDNLGGASEIQPSPSDWFDICGFDVYEGSDIDFIGKFLDTSGSMTLTTVRASNDLFDANVSNAGLMIREVFNTREDWITPFVTTLVPGNV